MAVDHPGSLSQETQRQKRAERRNGKATMQNTSISRANFTVRDGGKIIIENGGLDVTGTATGSGVLDWSGTVYFRGPTGVQGNFAVSGTTTLTGAVTLNSTLTVGSGQIKAGAVTITPTGGGMVQIGAMQLDGDSTGTIRSSGAVTIEGGGTTSLRVVGRTTTSDLLVFGDVTAATLSVSGAKSFRMPHPTKKDTWLRHGSTESPVSGIEYWGEGVIDASGHSVVELPDYFEALAKPDGRTVFVTGRGFSADWTDIEDGKFTVTGTAGRRFSWLVKAERFGGDFVVEEATDATDDSEE